MMMHTSHSVAGTEAVAAQLARGLRGGELIALHGELGAGKTQFARGIVAGLGGDPRAVSSPTFILLNVYDTPRLKVFHLDAYRVQGPEDFESIGFGELLEQGGVVVLEWPSRVAGLLPESRIDIYLQPISATSRTIRIVRSD
jgi:tRNA threonylcarbamoyladenosine biosynthesis protein TsaE